MKRGLKYLIGLLFCFLSLTGAAQELKATVTINSDKVQGTNKSVFNTLQKALTEFINNRKWTDATFAVNEKIDCTFTIIVSSQEDDKFKSEMQVVARRPVFDSGYQTTLLNVRDKQVDFSYTEFEPLDYTENTLENNLTASVIFYIYTILGLDFDSFGELGGTAYLQQAQQIVSLAQSQGTWNGWKPFDTNISRNVMITALTDNASEAFRKMWYTYHRKGLDEMAGNADRGRTSIIESLAALNEVKQARPTSFLLQMFSDAKLDEVVAIYSKATSQEKADGYSMLSNIFPAETTRLEALKK